jgi:hypothetical protein
MTTETIYVPILDGIQARVEIQIIQDSPFEGAPLERPIRRAPTARELHTLADLLTRRIYQFHPIE